MDELIKSLLQEQFERFSDIVADKVMKKIEEARRTPKAIDRRKGAQLLNMSLPTFDALIKSGDIKARRVGRRVLVDEASIVELMDSGVKLKYRRA